MEEIAHVCVKKGILVISDEIYEHIVYNGFEPVSFAALSPEAYNLTVTVNGLSKSYAMTGWRIGYAAGPKEIIEACVNLQSQSTSNIASFAQKAAIEALNGDQEPVRTMAEEFGKRRKYLLERMDRVPGVRCFHPQGAFYLFPNVSAYVGKKFNGNRINNSEELAQYLLDEARVALVPGEAFGAPVPPHLLRRVDGEAQGRNGPDRIRPEEARINRISGLMPRKQASKQNLQDPGFPFSREWRKRQVPLCLVARISPIEVEDLRLREKDTDVLHEPPPILERTIVPFRAIVGVFRSALRLPARSDSIGIRKVPRDSQNHVPSPVRRPNAVECLPANLKPLQVTSRRSARAFRTPFLPGRRYNLLETEYGSLGLPRRVNLTGLPVSALWMRPERWSRASAIEYSFLTAPSLDGHQVGYITTIPMSVQ